MTKKLTPAPKSAIFARRSLRIPVMAGIALFATGATCGESVGAVCADDDCGEPGTDDAGPGDAGPDGGQG